MTWCKFGVEGNIHPVLNETNPEWTLKHGIEPHTTTLKMRYEDAKKLQPTGNQLYFFEHEATKPGEEKLQEKTRVVFPDLLVVNISPPSITYDYISGANKDPLVFVTVADVRYFLINFDKISGWYNITNKQAYIGTNDAVASANQNDLNLIWKCYHNSMVQENGNLRLYRASDIFNDIMSKTLASESVTNTQGKGYYKKEVTTNPYISGKVSENIVTKNLKAVANEKTNPIIRDFQFSGITPAAALQQLLERPEMKNHFITLLRKTVYLDYRADTDEYKKGYSARIKPWMRKRIDATGINKYGKEKKIGQRPKKARILFRKEIRTVENHWETVLPADEDGSHSWAGVRYVFKEGEYVNLWMLLDKWGYDSLDALNEATLGFPSCPPIPADSETLRKHQHRVQLLSEHMLRTFRLYNGNNLYSTQNPSSTLMLPINPDRPLTCYTYHYRAFDQHTDYLDPVFRNYGIFEENIQRWNKNTGTLDDYIIERPAAIPWQIDVINPMEGIIHIGAPPGHYMGCNLTSDEVFDFAGATLDYQGLRGTGHIGSDLFFVEYFCRPIPQKPEDFYGFKKPEHIIKFNSGIGIGIKDYIADSYAVVDNRFDTNSDWTTAIKDYGDYNKFDLAIYNKIEVEKKLFSIKEGIKDELEDKQLGELKLAGFVGYGNEANYIPWGDQNFHKLDSCQYMVENGAPVMYVVFHTTAQPKPGAEITKEINENKTWRQMLGRW